MNPGLLRHRITIERQEAGQDCLGQPSSQWGEVGKLWVRMMEAKTQSQSDTADRRVESQNTVFRTRYGAASKLLQSGDRVRFRGRVYQITGTSEVMDGRTEWMDIDALHHSS